MITTHFRKENIKMNDIEKDTVEETAAPEIKEEKTEKKKSSKSDKKLEKEIEALKKELEEANAKLAEEADKYMRMIAEYDNFRRRAAKERESTYADAYSDAVTQILPILDNMERATKFTDADAVMQGVEMVLKSFTETLEKMGVFEIEAEGKEFDPNLHNAVMHIEDENIAENTVVEVLQKGYTKGDKVIRYAMVKVAN